ncbi:hypothetical protein KC19_1G192500, partial [Ceratodon purpureus]
LNLPSRSQNDPPVQSPPLHQPTASPLQNPIPRALRRRPTSTSPNNLLCLLSPAAVALSLLNEQPPQRPVLLHVAVVLVHVPSRQRHAHHHRYPCLQRRHQLHELEHHLGHQLHELVQPPRRTTCARIPRLSLRLHRSEAYP